MLSNHLILCPLLLPSIFPGIRVFSNEMALCIRWPKYWSFSITPMNIQGWFPLEGLLWWLRRWSLLEVWETQVQSLGHRKTCSFFPILPSVFPLLLWQCTTTLHHCPLFSPTWHFLLTVSKFTFPLLKVIFLVQVIITLIINILVLLSEHL